MTELIALIIEHPIRPILLGAVGVAAFIICIIHGKDHTP